MELTIRSVPPQMLEIPDMSQAQIGMFRPKGLALGVLYRVEE